MKSKRKGVLQSFKFIFPFVVREKNLFLLGLTGTLTASFCTWWGPQLLARWIDESFASQLLFWFAISEFTKLLMNYFSQKTFSRFGQNVIEKIRETMIEHLMRLPIRYFDRSSSGQIMTRVVNDVNSLTDFFQSGLVSIVGNLAFVLAIFFGIFSLNHRLAGILLLVFLPFLFSCLYFSEKLRVNYEETRNELSHFNSLLADFLFGMKTIRSLSLTKEKKRILNQQVRNYSQAQIRMVHTFALFNPVLSLGIGVLFFVLIIQGIPMVDQGELRTGEWIALLSYIFSLQNPLMEIADRWNFFLAGITGIDRIRNVFAEAEEKNGKIQSEKLNLIQMEKLSFSYPGSPSITLREIDFTIHRGDRIGIYGETGMGKTTLLQLIYGFYPPTSGVLNWNGKSYGEYQLSSIRNHFGVVEQFPTLFSGTVLDNISLFGQLKLEVHELKERFKGFRLISSLLDRLHEEVRERGGNLSMGERQMISFLRAYLKKPDIWILDEATAFFDEEAEQEFMNALAGLGPEMVVIQIAHRKEALTQMKRLVRVDQGAVRE